MEKAGWRTQNLAVEPAANPPVPVHLEMSSPAWIEPDTPLPALLTIVNRSPAPLPADIEYTIRHDPAPASVDREVAPDPPGGVTDRGVRSATIPARSFGCVSIGGGSLPTGAYRIDATARAGGETNRIRRHAFVMPAPMRAVSPGSRFGLNVSEPTLVTPNRRLGVGWVRFENMKWPMASSEPGAFRFDGTVGPWHVNHDAIFGAYAAAGVSILPFLFQTPEHATTAPSEVRKNRLQHPPKEPAQFAEFCFQTAARYGATRHPREALKTPDGKSGLGWMPAFEIWNEPNLDSPDWGAWVGPLPAYLDLFRTAAEAVKRADPKARVTHGGFAGMDLETVDSLRSHVYADGKRPLDFTDALNVHYYSGRTPPERATVDPNVVRSGASTGGTRTYEDDLVRLADWRDEWRPGLPIWLTETGYDTAGPYGISEELQAARLPRVVLLALGHGIDRVMVYRESGSTPGQHAASGLVRNDGSPKPAWFSYATLIRELDGATGGIRLPWPDSNVRLFAWTRGGAPLLVAWTVEGAAHATLALGRCSVTDAFGHREEKDLTGGVPLTIFPVYIGGIGESKPVAALVEEARRAEATRRQARGKLAHVNACLFDFGSTHHIGVMDLGRTRVFTPVLSQDVFDDTRGWGFHPRAAGQQTDRPWIRDILDRDGCRLSKGLQFRFRASPGRHRLRIGIDPVVEKVIVTVTGPTGGERTFEVTKKSPPVETDVDIGADASGGCVSVESDNYADLLWLTLIEEGP